MNQSRTIIIGILLSVILLIIFFITVDLTATFQTFQSIKHWYLYPAILLYLVSIMFRTIRWKILLNHLSPISHRRLYPVLIIRYMANNILPFRLGEFVGAYYLSHKENISPASGIATITLERVLDAITLLMLMGISLIILPITSLGTIMDSSNSMEWPIFVAIFAIPVCAILLLLTLVSYKPNPTMRIIKVLLSPLPQRFQTTLTEIAELFIEGLQSLRNPIFMIYLTGLSLLVWVMEATVFVTIAYALGLQEFFRDFYHLSWIMILTTCVSNIGSSLPSTPGGIGLFEIITRETLSIASFGAIDRASGTAFATIVHAVLIIPVIILGQFYLWTQNIPIKQISKWINPQPNE
ncbi:MAG: lysylphosphatidylglycerol synthase transmembrane domain-containing protein [Dehalococcoidia bacterium]